MPLTLSADLQPNAPFVYSPPHPPALPCLVSITPRLPKSIATSGAGDMRNREGGSSVMDESLGNILDRRMRNEKLSAPEKKKKEKLANG